jgi:hypothetical protein
MGESETIEEVFIKEGCGSVVSCRVSIRRSASIKMPAFCWQQDWMTGLYLFCAPLHVRTMIRQRSKHFHGRLRVKNR